MLPDMLPKDSMAMSWEKWIRYRSPYAILQNNTCNLYSFIPQQLSAKKTAVISRSDPRCDLHETVGKGRMGSPDEYLLTSAYGKVEE